MKINKFKKLISIFMVCLLALSGCSPDTKKPDDIYEYSLDSFDSFINDLFTSEVTGNSITLNYTLAHPENFGITSVEPSYGSTDLEHLDDDSQTIEAINALKSFDYNKLSDDQKLTYDILLDNLETTLEYSELYLYDKTLSPTIGLNCQLPILLAEYSFRTKQDVYDYVALIKTTDDYFSFLLELEKMKSEKGLFMTDDLAEQIIEQCDIFTENPEENYLIEIFNDKIDEMKDFSDTEREKLKQENKKAVLEHVVPAYDLLANGLEELMGTGKYEGGLCNYPDGDAYYRYLIRSGVGTNRSVDEIEKLIDRYMKLAFYEMGTILRENPNILDEVEDASFPLSDPYEILDDLQERIYDEFPKLPKTSYTIKYVHPSLEDNLSPAFYLTPAIDDYTQNVIYINQSEQYAEQDIYTTLAHEGFPGHLYQMVYTAAKGISPVRSLLSYSGFTEGWATYVELLSYRMGAIEENMGALLSANQLITLCVYAKCDIGVNYHGWTVDDVSDYVSSLFGELEESVMKEIYDAMVSEPANYLNYVVGCMEFMELRTTAEDTLGNKFDPIAFHDFILTTGPAPFEMIAERLAVWLSKQ